MKNFLIYAIIAFVGCVILYIVNPSHFMFKIVDHYFETNLYVPTKQEVARKKEISHQTDKLLACIKGIGPSSVLQLTEYNISKMMTIDFILFERRFNEKYCLKSIKCWFPRESDSILESIHFSNCLKDKEKVIE